METEAVAVATEQQAEDREVVRQEIRAELQSEFDTRLEQEVSKISKRMQEENSKVVTEALERYKKELAPPSEQDIQKLLSQEYLEFKLDIRYKGEMKAFVIQELPQKTEKKIYKKIKDVLVPFSSELAALTMNMMEGDAAKKIVQMMNTFEPMLDLMASVATIVLNPNGEDSDLTDDWVKENLSSTRILNIVNAQLEANRMRDFFSLLFRGTKLLS